MPRPPRGQGSAVLVTCAETFHKGAPGFAEHGSVLLGGITARPGPDGTSILHWTGRLAESSATVRSSGVSVHLPGMTPRLPVKQFRGPGGARTWRFACTCGLEAEVPEDDLAEIIRRYRAERPGERVVIPLAWLARRSRS